MPSLGVGKEHQSHLNQESKMVKGNITAPFHIAKPFFQPCGVKDLSVSAMIKANTPAS